MIQYTGATNAPATVLTLGDGGTTRNGEKLYLGLQVTRQIQSDWVSEDDIGILARNLDSSLIDLRLVSGFTVTIRRIPHLFDLHAALGAMFCCFFQFQGSNS